MLNHLLTQLLRSFGIFFRTIRAFFTRKLAGLWARLKRFTNFSRQATKVAADSLQSAAAIAKKPTSRGDYVETGRLFISKKFLLTLAVGLIALGLLIYFVVWPFILGHFLTAHFYVEDSRIDNWTGRVIVYSDEAKTIPLYEGKLEEGLLQGRGKEYDESGLLAYEGEFADGLRQGAGAAYEDGMLVYEGDFAAGVFEGEGTLYEAGIKRYEGTFAAGVQSGEGTEYYDSGAVHYRGIYAEGQLEGEGIEYTEQGEKYYEGGFSLGLYSGEGSLYPEKDQRVDATFTEGEPDGAIQWYKAGKLYYDGEADGLTPSGFGILYSQSGKTAYVGQMANGTVDGTWLVTLTAAEFREALGEAGTADYDTGDGFIISSPAIGLSALCSYQTADSEPTVHTVYISAPREERFALLPGQDGVSLDGWPDPAAGERTWRAVDGVNTRSGNYDCKTYQLEGCRAELLSDGDEAVQLSWALQTALPSSGAESAAGAETQAAAQTQKELESFLNALDGMAGAGAAQLATDNPYCGGRSAADALKGCMNPQEAEAAVDALLTYWEYAERRTALENNLTRTKELLSDARRAAASGGSAAAVTELENQQAELNASINTCIVEMSKAATLAQNNGAGDPAQYALSELAVLFNPITLEVDDLTLVATAYAQAVIGETLPPEEEDTAGEADGEQAAEGEGAAEEGAAETAPSGEETEPESAVDSEAIRQSLQTILADMAAAYQNAQSAIDASSRAAAAVTDAAGAYSMGAGSKADWYNAVSAQMDSQAAVYASLCSFTRQVNALNSLTGGWVSRTQGWLTDVLLPLYEAAAKQ